MSKRERFHLTLQAEPWSTPAVIRLRRALKLLLRSFGLRCTDCRELHQEGQHHDDEHPQAAEPPAARRAGG